MVNVPTVVWIDEDGRIVRPNDVAFTTDKGGRYANVSTEEQMALLRSWVHGRLPTQPDDVLVDRIAPPSAASQAARAHFGLGWWLQQSGRADAAQHHFRIGGELAPDDFMNSPRHHAHARVQPVRTGVPQMVADWLAQGHTYYLPLPVD